MRTPRTPKGSRTPRTFWSSKHGGKCALFKLGVVPIHRHVHHVPERAWCCTKHSKFGAPVPVCFLICWRGCVTLRLSVLFLFQALIIWYTGWRLSGTQGKITATGQPLPEDQLRIRDYQNFHRQTQGGTQNTMEADVVNFWAGLFLFLIFMGHLW